MVDSIVDEKVVARCPKWLWSFVAFMAVIGLLTILLPFFDTGNKRASNTVLWSFGSGLFLLAGLMATYVARYQIEASKAGLRWQGTFGCWRSVSWPEVTDFYDACGAERKQDHSVVLFQDGQKLTFTRSLEGYIALKNAITRYATSAGKSVWESRSLKGKPASASV